MKNINIICALSLLCTLSACELEPYELPAEELYTRAFIKKFGLVDPNHTWNCAHSTDVTIVTNGEASYARVMAKRGSKYYLVAEITELNGTVKIPIDVPESVTDLKVEVDGNYYYTGIGGTVNADKPASRTYIYNGTAQDNNGSTGHMGGISVTDIEGHQRHIHNGRVERSQHQRGIRSVSQQQRNDHSAPAG